MSDLDRAVEQFQEAMGSRYGYDGNMGETEHDIVEALLPAGWRPPEVTGQEHFDREYARKVTQYRAAFNEVTKKMTSDALEWKGTER